LPISTYKEQIEKKQSNNVQYYKDDLTDEFLCNLLQIKNKDQNLGITIQQPIKFFKMFRFGLCVLDIYLQERYRYKPEKESKNINPSTLYILVHNNHTYKLNNNVSSFFQILNTNVKDDNDYW